MNRKLGRLLRPGMGAYFFVMAAFCAAALLVGHYWLAAGEMTVTVVTFLLYVLDRTRRERKIQQYIQSASNTLEASSGGEAPLPAVMVRLGDGDIVWGNHRFSELTGYADTMTQLRLEEVLPDFTLDWLTAGKTESPHDAVLGNRRYRVYGTTIRAEDNRGTMLGVLYFSDLTELYQVRDEYIRSRPVVAIILIDNYEELTKNLTESAISSLNAKLNETITRWTEGYSGLLRRLERNRFLFIFEKRDLERAKENKFSLLEDIHEIVNSSGLPASISIGLGVDGESFEESYDFAALGIEMALSRGGDQAVIKDRVNFNFYGGRNREADYRSKVRSRVTANSLMELIGQSGRVFIMGHKNADLDAVGAAMGISCLCRKRGKTAQIVIDLEKNASQSLLAELKASNDFSGVFVSCEDALLEADAKSLLIVVDTNRPDQVESRALLESIPRGAVIDHHRRAATYITNATMSFHEPYASSACELMTELLEELVEQPDILRVEAEAMLSGIMLDTKDFTVRTGERTFEAAAFLRRAGADTSEVKKLLQTDMEHTVARYKILQTASIYRADIAIAAPTEPQDRIVAAQAADELLNIAGVTASMVIYPMGDGDVFISARSIGELNVQLVMEALGGSCAAA